MKRGKVFVLLFGFAAFYALAEPRTEPMNTPDGVGGIRYYNGIKDLVEASPESGIFVSHLQGPNSTFLVFKTAEGKGRPKGKTPKVNMNRHGEEAAMVIKGSLLFKSGYNGEFERVMRVGDMFVIPKCMPHGGGVFGWDNNEETILITTFVDGYKEYGPDHTGKVPDEIANKFKGKHSGMSETEECKKMKSPKVTWTGNEEGPKMTPVITID